MDIELKTKYVSEGMEPYLNRFHTANPILISAPTGSGKTTFIIKKLLPHFLLRFPDSNVIILSNRIALDFQIKNEIETSLSSYFPQKHFAMQFINLSYVPAIRNPSSKDIVAFSRPSGNIITLRYQNAYLLDRMSLSGPCLLVMDEVHYFTSDALFNTYTSNLITLISKFQNAIRVYLTATPDLVKGAIFSYENLFQQGHMGPNNCYFNYGLSNDNPPSMILPKNNCFDTFYIRKNYSNYSCYYFHKMIELLQQIKSHATTEKWLIFVNKKTEGMQLAKQLRDMNISCSFQHAENKQTKSWKRLLHENQLPTQVLITTKVLDNGFSLKDSNLTHIVLPFTDQTTLLQMIGRKRLRTDEHVTLYFKVPSIPEIRSKKLKYNKMYYFIHQYYMKGGRILPELWKTQDKSIHQLFYITEITRIPRTAENSHFMYEPSDLNGIHLYLNPLAEVAVSHLCSYFWKLNDLLDTSDQDIEHVYISFLSKWLDKEPSEFHPMIDCSPILSDFCDTILQKYTTTTGLNEEEFFALYTELLPAFDLLKNCYAHSDPKHRKADVNTILKHLEPPLKVIKRQKRFYIRPLL